MHHIIIPNNSYGEATYRLRNTINKCQSIRWLNASITDRRLLISYLTEQIQCFLLQIRHLSQYAHPMSNLNLIEGGWSLLHQHCSDVDPYYPCGHRFDDYLHVLGALVRDVESTITSSPKLLSLIKPPLWPIPGKPNIAGGPLIACQEILRDQNLDVQYDSQDWRVAWGLLCQAEFNVRSHLLYDLLGEALVAMNPFTPLLNLYTPGCIPLGWDNTGFCVYCFRK